MQKTLSGSPPGNAAAHPRAIIRTRRPIGPLVVALLLAAPWAGAPAPARADIFECVDNATGDRIFRNRPCGVNERTTYTRQTEPAPIRPRRPADQPALPATQAPGNPAQGAPTADAPAAGPEAEQAPETIGRRLQEIDELVLTHSSDSGGTSGVIHLSFKYRNSEANQEIRWEVRRSNERALARCRLYLDKTGGEGDTGERGGLILESSDYFRSYDSYMDLYIPRAHLIRNGAPTFGMIECTVKLGNGRTLKADTGVAERIQLTYSPN